MHNNTTSSTKLDIIYLKCNVIDLSDNNNVYNNTINYNKNNNLFHKNMFEVLNDDDNGVY